MIVSKCPLRVSLVGGSTDLEEFIETNGHGSVISFPCNLYTYITLFLDKNGYNATDKSYILNYTTREVANSLDEIKNNVAREALKYFEIPPVSISFHTDVFSVGSGLASSSSYLVSLVRAIHAFQGRPCGHTQACTEALEIERKFNPLTGYQDPYGCGLGGFKRMDFKSGGKITTKTYRGEFFNNHDCYLIYTGISRSSTKILKTLDLNRAREALPLVDVLDNALRRENYKTAFKVIKEAWLIKKQTSPHIMANTDLQDLDEVLARDKRIKAHKLCGAGGGGYFLVFVEKDEDLSSLIKNFNDISFKIKPDNVGVQVANIGKAAVFM